LTVNMNSQLICYFLCLTALVSMTCGRSTRIIDGEEVAPHSVPWMVYIKYQKKGWCGGSLLARKFVLTAGHCVQYHPNVGRRPPPGWYEWFTVFTGLHSIKDIGRKNTRRLRRIVFAPKFKADPKFQENYKNDLAILELEYPVKLSNYVKPIVLARPSDGEWPAGTKFVASGWGLSSINPLEYPDKLHSVILPRVRDCLPGETPGDIGNVKNECMIPHENIIYAGYFKDTNKSLCSLDSGGPLTRIGPYSTMPVKLVGVVRSSYCNITHYTGQNIPSWFTEVAKYVPWIEKILKRGAIESEIGSDYNDWGDWGGWDMCPNGEHAVAFAVKHQVDFRPDGSWDTDTSAFGYDNTGLNSICLVCKSMVIRCSSQGPWGTWSTPFIDDRLKDLFPGVKMLPGMNEEPLCTDGLQRIYVENQKSQGVFADDVGLYYIGMYCSHASFFMLQPPGIFLGSGDGNGKRKVPGIESTHWECEIDHAICGINTRNYNKSRRRRHLSVGQNFTRGATRSAYDDVSLTGVKFKCCKIK